jgi:predicted metalloprotease with PDZ domain
MLKNYFLLFIMALLSSYAGIAQNQEDRISSVYKISFDNRVHHEAHVHATFTNIKNAEAEFSMSRSSPGRYALHEFMKNVYRVKVTDGAGRPLEYSRPDPYSWKVKGHDGTIKVSYILFANHGDGTYSQIDETHAHLNMPATFVYMSSLGHDAFKISFDLPKDNNWKIATQLKHLEGNTYYARDLQYFLDSPTEISDHSIRSLEVDGQTVNFVLHHNGTEAQFDEYFDKVKTIVFEQKAVFGELPEYDHDNYYFLACYMPHVDGDGMEHRNSTILTDTEGLAEGGMENNIGTVSHEFFHGWNVERIRPKSLEPFDFGKANISGELWFGEGFTSYYTYLILCRTGLIGVEDFINGQTRSFNYVWNSPGRRFFNPIEMSYQAPFVDDATSIDPNNRSNTFISYYTYGSMLGLALDLSLRETGLNLDDYMKLVWRRFGKTEVPYTVRDLHNSLNDYAGQEFGDHFFNNYIYQSGMPEMNRLFGNVGVTLTQNEDLVLFGASFDGNGIVSNTKLGSSLYNAGLEKGDIVLKIGDFALYSDTDIGAILRNFKPGNTVRVVYERFGKTRETSLTFVQNPFYRIALFETVGLRLDDKKKKARTDWLGSKY